MNKKNWLTILTIMIFTFSACSSTEERIIKPLNKEILTYESNDWYYDNTVIINKLVFAIPDLDKKMCEKFPKLIIEDLEAEKGVIDAQFTYEGHEVRVIYDPEMITEEAILNYETYSWIGTEFVSNEVLEDDVKRIFDKRKENNVFEMPEDHME